MPAHRAQIERGHAKDLADVAQLLGRGLVESQRLRELFEAIQPSLYRHPFLLAGALFLWLGFQGA